MTTIGKFQQKENKLRRRFGFMSVFVCVVSIVFCAQVYANDTIGKWRRYVVTMPNPSYSGNPFELEVDATFVHTQTGTSLSIPGYYAGNNEWEIAFMPTLLGEWTYKTFSSDSNLNGISGAVDAVDSGHPGMLKPASAHPKKWKFTDGNYVLPIGLLFSVFLESATPNQFTQAVDFLKNDVGGHLFNFRLTNRVFTGSYQNHQFDLTLWDQLDERMEILTERGLGVTIMPYTDGAGKPPWAAKSATEKLLIRYMIARLASFPVVSFNTGIDISEYRNAAWINWYGQEVKSLDPYGHPLSSRYGGGSGNSVMSGQTYDSRGASTALINELVGFFQGVNVAVGVDDNWGEQFSSRGNFRPSDIRRAFWKCVMAGGLWSHVRDDSKTNFPGANDPDAWFHRNNMASKLESEQWLKLINPFIEGNLGITYGEMVPESSLVSNGYAMSDPNRSKILYFLMGSNDKFDVGNGGAVTVKLTSISQNYLAKWFDTRSGNETGLGIITGGQDHVLVPPSTDDWVLLLSSASQDQDPPAVPFGLQFQP